MMALLRAAFVDSVVEEKTLHALSVLVHQYSTLFVNIT